MSVLSAFKAMRAALNDWRSFDPQWYLSQNADVAAAGVNPFVHYLRHGKSEGRRPAPIVHARRIVDLAKALLRDVSDLDPDLYADEAFRHPDQLPFVDGVPSGKHVHAFEAILSSLDAPFPYVTLLPALGFGGAELTGVRIVKALIEHYGPRSTLVIFTDDDNMEARSWLPDGVEYRVLSAFAPLLTSHERCATVELLISSLQPTAVVNVNSRAGWQAYLRKGRAFANFTKLFATAYCRDYTRDGRPAGYVDTHLPKCLPWLTGVYLDNSTILEDLLERFAIPSLLHDKFMVLCQPVEIDPKPGPLPERLSSPRVCWAGRLTRQKNLALLPQIAALMPSVEFEVWGRGDAEAEAELCASAKHAKNIVIKGGYSSISDLPLATYRAYLYTTLWDGLPNALLEIAAAGVPVVASDIGGIGELVTPERGWKVQDYDRAHGYIRALAEIIADPDEAERRVGNMRAHIASKHSWDAFRAALSRGPTALIESS